MGSRPIALLAFLLALSAGAGEPAVRALVVAGESGEPNFAANFKDWTQRFHAVLTGKCGIPAANVAVFMERKDALPGVVKEASTRENVLKALAAWETQVHPGDQAVLVLMGHGSTDAKSAKLCLPGADLSAADLAAALKKVPTRDVIVIDLASASHPFVAPLSHPDRIIVAATNNPAQGNATYFAEFFLAAYEKPGADANGDGKLQLLETFNAAALNCAKWYLRQYFSDGGEWRIEGKQSRELWKKFYGSIPEKKMGAPMDPEADDAEPELGEWGPQWMGRRMCTEFAQLEDNGDKVGSAVFNNSAFAPVKGVDPGEDGKLAAQTILGMPRGLAGAPVFKEEEKEEKK
ncbi:MAG: hypothetical protein M5U26_28695 [Planctomycetota bacterium]|nr:hypothetical protein [Planctomycetota bacterium]